MMDRRSNDALPTPFVFPPLCGGSPLPVWTGRGFRIGDQDAAILCYETGSSGWTDELTKFHEDTAGENHYIDRASRQHAVGQLRRWLAAERATIIDVGCSSGHMLKALQREFRHAEILGADYVRGPLEALSRTLPCLPLLQFDLTKCPLPDKSADAVILLNVLEHIEDDEAALRQVARILKPSGVAIIEVPAGPELYDVYDKLLLHCRRYSMKDLLQKVSRNGFKVLTKSHLGFFLYPPFWMTKKRNQRYVNENQQVQRAIVSKNITTASSSAIMNGVMKYEAFLRKFVYYPRGIRCLVTCRPAR